MIKSIIQRVREEPVRFYAMLISLVSLAVAFGVELSDVQRLAIDGAIVAGLAFVVRSFTRPAA